MTITARLPAQMEQRLADLAKLTKRSKSFLIKEALECYLEDLEDVAIANERRNDPNAVYYTTEEVLRAINANKATQ